MRRALLVLLLSTVAAPSAFGQGGINLFWNDCGEGGSAGSNKTFACNTNTGDPFTMFLSAYPPVEMPQFVGVEAYVDFIANAQTLPSWWQLDTGQCRAGALSVTCDPVSYGFTTCPPIWGESQPVGIFDVTGVSAAWGFRVRIAAAVPQPVPLTAEMVGQEMVVGAVRITRAKSTGADACEGCLTGACMVLSRVTLVQAEGVGDFVLTTPGVNNWVQYNGGNGFYNCEVPAANRTWGAIKALYR